MVSVCLPSDALLQHLPSYLGFSYLGHGVSLQSCSSKAQPLLLTLDEGYLLTATFPDLQHGIAPLGPPVPAQPPLLGLLLQYATGGQWRNSSRKNEGIEPKQRQHLVVDVTGDRSKVRCWKEQYCIGIWNVRPRNQSKLEVVKQEMARVNVDTLGISELKWTEMGKFNSDDHLLLDDHLTQMISTTVGKNTLEEIE